MAKQWFLPGIGMVGEDGTDEFFIPGYGMLDNAETVPATDLVINNLEVVTEIANLALVAGAVLTVQNLEVATEIQGPISLDYHPAGGRMFLTFY
jgi:hypothetical protein